MQIPVERQPIWQHPRVILVMITLLILVLGVMISGFFSHTKPSALQTSRIQLGSLDNQISAFGILVPQKIQSLIAMTEGRVLQLVQRPGAMLEAGQPILQLVNPKLQRQLEEQELALQAQQAEFLLLQQQLEQEQLQLRHDLRLAQAEQQLLQTQLAAKQELFRQQIVSALDFAQSEALLTQAKQKVLLAEEKLKGFAKSRQNRLSAGELNRQRAEKQRDIAKQDVLALAVSSDISGQLIALDESLKPGSQVVAGQALGQVAEPGQLLAELKIGAVDAALVKPGQAVTLNIKGKPMLGEVSWVSPNVVDNFLRVDVALLGELPDTARANIEVKADINVGVNEQTLLSDRASYIQKPQQRQALFVWDASSAQYLRREVLIGSLTAKQMQLLDGVKAGEQVLLQVPAALLNNEVIAPEDLNG
jgi:multidrug efflux pump subunit AcrA (membrane-fusion protein)